ncbi:MAG: PDZ domain-containing protein [Kiritimatiellae bacterium]|nr:PDZ domain-containing protein [Kiritimatiellia bacterium]
MISAIAAACLAAAIPTDHLSSVATASYWYKKDERGKGDAISEKAMPRRFPAFAMSKDEFLVRDPFVRARHLDRIEICFRDETVPAREMARTANPDAVVLKTERPVEGVVPLAFTEGEPAERETWYIDGMLAVKASDVGTNESTFVSASTGKTFRRGMANSIYLDSNRNVVGLDFGERVETAGGALKCVPPDMWRRISADSFEKAALKAERTAADASLGILFKLEPKDKDNEGGSSRYRYSYGGREEKNEIDAVGYAVAGKVIVPCDIDGEKIARINKIEATFPDGSATNLVFAGALAEWNAVVLDVPEEFRPRLKPLEIAPGKAEDFDNRVAWVVTVENENGRIVATAERSLFNGVRFIRGAKFTPKAGDGNSSSFTLDENGRIASLRLARRFKTERWSSSEREPVATQDISRFVAGEGTNPEFAPRNDKEKNLLVWLGVESVRLTDALARDRKAQSFIRHYSRPPYVTEVYAGSPAEKSGLKTGDVLLAVRRGNEAERELEAEEDYFFYGRYGMPWPDVESELNKLMTTFGAGASVTIIYARDGKRHEAQVVLESAPVHFKNAVKSRNRALGLSVKDMTFEVRRFFKFDDAEPGIVIAKVKPGSPADVAGLEPFELITEVNGEKVTGAKDFAAKIKGKTDFTFAVRKLAQTRMVKLHVAADAEVERQKQQADGAAK